MSKRIYEQPIKEEEKKKPKRKRKPMTEEQRAAAAERLKVAREKRSNGKKNASVHSSIRDLPDDHYLSPKKVRGWLKEWTNRLSSTKKDRESKDANLRRNYQIAEAYVKNMKTYLQTGIWCDSHYGAQREHQIQFKSIAMAYNSDGSIKRTVGVWYPDVGVWKKEYEV